MSRKTDKMKEKKILVLGLFLTEKNKHRILRAASNQLAEMFSKYGFEIIKVSSKVNEVARLFDTVFTIIFNAKNYRVAMVPLFGTRKNFIWNEIATRLLKLLDKKIILIIRGGSIPQQLQTHPHKFLKAFRRADDIICPSAFIAHSLQQYNIPFTIIENVVMLGNYPFQQKTSFSPSLLWMRTIEDIYNPEMAVRVLALVAKKYPHAKMVMAGYDRGSLAMVQQLAKELQVADKVIFPGYISQEQKVQYAAAYDIYICTNRIDNAPVTFVEMMALGLPIVSVNTGGIPYLVKDKETALLSELDDDEAMTENIFAIIEQPQLAQQLVNNAKAYANNFGEEKVMEKWRQVLMEEGKN